jgi:hypothetical protein
MEESNRPQEDLPDRPGGVSGNMPKFDLIARMREKRVEFARLLARIIQPSQCGAEKL